MKAGPKKGSSYTWQSLFAGLQTFREDTFGENFGFKGFPLKNSCQKNTWVYASAVRCQIGRLQSTLTDPTGVIISK